ncbi:hypothetical protein BB560_005164 [Smittium megazygosporum]|uniref:Translation initiation factor eIF2B subunit beta n=1 Tax=Smittium megazygosporum TaxID=133381 RepID=A0A2T9Z772_9FUNG|nr:hypothetical protein BB560_005164 [Smittium megazygosporum]
MGQYIVNSHPKVRTEAENSELLQDSKELKSHQTPTGTGFSTPTMGLGQAIRGSSVKLADLVDSSLIKSHQDRLTVRTKLKNCILQGINDFIEELEASRTHIASHALDYIQSNEIILTCGYSKTVERFFKRAAAKRKFTVIVTETAPWYSGQKFAKSLASNNIETIVISDVAAFAMMSRVNKVIIGANVVMANGGLIAIAGSQIIAAAAKYHSIPVIACAGLYKFSPLFPFDQQNLSELVSPDGVFPYKDEIYNKIDVINPSTDYVSPELIDLIIDNLGGHLPSYQYRILQENYNTEDIKALRGNT